MKVISLFSLCVYCWLLLFLLVFSFVFICWVSYASGRLYIVYSKVKSTNWRHLNDCCTLVWCLYAPMKQQDNSDSRYAKAFELIHSYNVFESRLLWQTVKPDDSHKIVVVVPMPRNDCMDAERARGSWCFVALLHKMQNWNVFKRN